MLAVNHYPREYIDECRARVNLQLATYRGLATAARNQVGVIEGPLHSAIEFFEPVFLNNTVLFLDSHFVHRTRAKEEKDGNPLMKSG